jgi:hypothetical protein
MNQFPEIPKISRRFYSDEATFKLSGHVNRHKRVYWDTQNPDLTMETVESTCSTRLGRFCYVRRSRPYFFEGILLASRT